MLNFRRRNTGVKRLLSLLLLALAVVGHDSNRVRGKKGTDWKKKAESRVLVLVEALVSGSESAVPLQQVNAIAERMGGEFVPTESFFLPSEAAVRPLVQATFSVFVPLDSDVTAMLDFLEAMSEELRQAKVIRLIGVEEISDTHGGKKINNGGKRNISGEKRHKKSRNRNTRFLQVPTPLFVLELTACPSMCGSPIISDEDLDAAAVLGINIEDLEPALLFTGYCLPTADTCVCTGGFGGSTCDILCNDLDDAVQCDASNNCAWCETTRACLATTSAARTEDEIVLCPSCSQLSGKEQACVASKICEYCASSRTCFDFDDPSFECSFSVVNSSPIDGEIDVAVTRETVLYFSEAVQGASISKNSIVVDSQSQEIDSAVIHVSSDGKTVTIFYPENLPANSKVNVRAKNIILSASGKALAPFKMSFTTLGLVPVANTYVCGRVFASGFKTLPDGSTLTETPLVGATITVDGAEGSINAITDIDGAFVLGPTPSGTFFVHIDGRTSSQGEEIGGVGAYFPFVGKSWTAVAGKMNNKETIYLPLVPPGALKLISETETTTVGFTPAIVEENPEFAGVSLQVPPGALIDPAGTEGMGDKMVGIAPVEPDRLPGQLPETLRFPIVITIQTRGGNNFDLPVPACFPNLPDPETGSALSPGDSTSLWSFNHDTGRFEIVGPATVSNDGLLTCSDEGFGILAPGWHGVSPGTSANGPKDQDDCEAGNECCQMGPNGGSPNPPEKGTIGQVLDKWSTANVAKDCIETIYDKVLGKKLNSGYECASSLYNAASGVVLSNANGAPTGLGDIASRIFSFKAGFWGAFKGCNKAIKSILPISTGFNLGLSLYKCARGAQQAVAANLCDTNSPGCGEGPTESTFCTANEVVDDALSAVDGFVAALEGFNLLRRKLADFPEVLTESEVEEIMLGEFYGNDLEQYSRTKTVQSILDGFETVQAAVEAGEAEAFALYQTFAADMEVVRDLLQATVLDLYRPMLEIADSNLNFINSMNEFVVDRAQYANGGAKTLRELYIYLKTEDDDEFRIKTTPTGDIVGLTLPQNKDFIYYAYNVQENLFGIAQGTTSSNGIPTILPSIGLSIASDDLLVDTDGDGLCDLCEFTIGTNPDLSDSDEDGTGDLQELLAGTNPLDGLALTTGVVATVPLVGGRGNPTQIELSGSFLFMIMDGGGIAVYNIFNALQPALVALLEPEKDFAEVSADSNRLLARTTTNDLILFSGAEFSDTVDVTALYPRLLNVPISSTHMSAQFAYVGTTFGSVLVFESNFGSHVQTLNTFISGEVLALALTPVGIITCVMDSVLIFFEPSVALWKETPFIQSVQESQSYTLQVGSSTALTMSFEGELDVFSTDGTLIGSTAAFPTPTFDFVITEERGGDINILTVNGIEVWNFIDASAPEFGARFEVDGILRKPVLAAGGGFLYLGTMNGLVVLNTNPADVFQNEPNIIKLGAVYRGIEISSGNSVEERRVLSIFTDVEDDVGLRNVVFFANGAQLKIDSSFPFSATVTVPSYDTSTSLRISAIAWDTAGNMAEEAILELNIVEDKMPPLVLRTSPAQESSIAFEEGEEKIQISISFTEPFAGAVDRNRFSLRQIEPSVRDINTNLLELLLNPGLGEVGVSVPASELPLGKYEVQLGAGFIFDVNGNPSESYTWEFTVTVVSNVRTAIAVIDESNDSQSYVDVKWAEFRAIYPDRPFCLLRPVSSFGFLNIPDGFDGIFSDVNRDEGDTAQASDWFTICKLNEIDPLIRKVGLFVDNSGSMTISTVAASLNLFLQKVAQANLETVEVYRGDERWIDVFLVDL
jgi:Bacterial Ig-like domain